ncbi:MAG TPA: tetratricopeptide repeat protein [Candidatus Eisenbacteria bacterium]|nr:tetratricopeptide repeat protein [Candidatus Eisenbacteria bacterium]
MNLLRSRVALVSMLAALALTLTAPRVFALTSGDLIKQGVQALKDGKAEKALDLFTQAEKLDPNSPRPHYFIASALEKLGKPDSAKVQYNIALSNQPKYPEALTGLGNLLRKQGQTAEGTAKLEEAVKYGPKDPGALYSLGQAYLKDKRYEDAEKIFRKGTLLKQGRALFLAGTALALEGKGELKPAEELFIRARETDPNNLRVRMDLGGFYDRKKIPVLAAPEYGRAAELDPMNPETHFLYGKALVGMNEFNAGLAAFQKAESVDSTYAPAYLEAGRLFARAKRATDAAEKFQKYTELRPEEFTGYYELGKALSGSRVREERITAVGVLEKANEIKPDQPEVLGALCKLYTEQGADSREQAIAACDKYVASADSIEPAEKLKIGGLFAAMPDSGKALPLLRAAVAEDSTLAKDANFQIGLLLFTSKDWGAAVPYFRATLAYDSTFVPALLNLGLCQLQGGEKSGAIETFRRSLAIKPDDARTLIWVGQTLLTMEADSLPVAFETYEAAIAADSTRADAQRGAGLALLLMDRCGDGITYLGQATAMDPDHVQGHVWLAQAYSKCKDLNRAKEEFNKALEIDPTNGPASTGLQIIRNFEAKQQARPAGATGP